MKIKKKSLSSFKTKFNLKSSHPGFVFTIPLMLGIGLLIFAVIGISQVFVEIVGPLVPQLITDTPTFYDYDEITDDDDTNNIFFVLGHTNEPAFGVDPDVHDGKHAMEIRLSDDATDLTLPQVNTELFLDKYYFKDVKKYNKADSVEDATQIETGIPINEAFGDPGHYIHRQIVQDGIYGYHVYGTIDYYGAGERDVDITFFCLADGMDDPAKFESVAGGITFGEFGCPESTDEIKFPTKKGHHSSNFDKEDRDDDKEKDD